MYISMSISISILYPISISIYLSLYLSIYLYIYVYIYIYIYVSIYIYIYCSNNDVRATCRVFVPFVPWHYPLRLFKHVVAWGLGLGSGLLAWNFSDCPSYNLPCIRDVRMLFPYFLMILPIRTCIILHV